MSQNQPIKDIVSAIESLRGVLFDDHTAPVPIPKVSSKFVEIGSDSDDSDEDEDIKNKVAALEKMQQRDEIIGPIRSVHEKPLDQIELESLPDQIPFEAEMIPICVVHHFSGNFSIAKSTNGKGLTPGSLLADSNRKPVTRVLELFGPIDNPQIILKGQIPIGTELFAVLLDAEIPDPEMIAKQFRGCDASNRFDEEAPYQDFSDDEAEMAYKAKIKSGKKKPSSSLDIDAAAEAAGPEAPVGYVRTYGSP